MKRKELKVIFAVILLMAVSCNEPITVVTNYVHADGSVTRKIEMRNVANEFKTKDFQVPFDSTWTLSDSIEISAKGDTTWIRRAEKTFDDVAGINNTYREDTAINEEFDRSAAFEKKFRWFNTEYRFTEKIGKIMQFGYPIKNYLNDAELLWFYSPQELTEKQKTGPDSLKYRALNDSVESKTEKWMLESLISDWIGRFSVLTSGKGTEKIVSDLRSREKEISLMMRQKFIDDKFDSLWKNGVIITQLIGEDNAARYRAEADSALLMLNDEILPSFGSYNTRTVMPGKLTGTNGFIDSTGIVLWPVSSELFLTQDYEMWAESKRTNAWAWFISGLFVLFVASGWIIKTKKG